MGNLVICVDAGIVVRLVTGSEFSVRIADLWRGWQRRKATIVAPTLLFYEVANALHRYRVRGELLADEAAEALGAALALGIDLHGNRDLHRRAHRLVQRFDLPATYDAHYLALAEHLRAELWTTDAKLRRALDPPLPWLHPVGGAT